MNKIKIFCLVTGLSTAFSSANEYHQCGWENCASKGHAESLRAQWNLLKTELPGGNGRQYARDRIIDVKHQLIDFTPDFDAESLSGTATITFSPIAKPLESLSLDAVDLDVKSVTCAQSKVGDWSIDENSINLVFEKPIAPGVEVSVAVEYSAQPRHGLYFRTEKMGYTKGDDHLWTQGEPEMHRHWFPGYDYPNERFTTEVICHVPEGMTVLSNGELIAEKTEDGITTVHWHQKKEHVNYLISVVAGYMDKLDGKYGDLELAFYTPPSFFAEAENSFRDTERILGFMEKEIGIDFPWAKYYNICVSDFMWGGMENTSVTTLTTRTLFSKESENLRSSHRLDAHEITHQWFGDLLTCKDWSQLWLNEGFATYYTHLYDLEKFGNDQFRYGLLRDSDSILKNKDEKPIVWRGYQNPKEQFDYRAYPKGSWVLHMLRSELGPELFRDCIKTYTERNRNRSVVTADLMEVLEEKSGRSMDEFFDQWVFHGGEPELDVKYTWDDKAKKAKFTVKQTQKVSEKVLLFDFALPVRFIDEKGNVVNRVGRVREATQDFAFDLPAKPKIVRIDPEVTLLTSIKFSPSDPMLQAQLENQGDMVGRLLGIRSLGGKKDDKSLKRLETALSSDPFYGVRIEAAKALAKTYTPDAFAILKKHTAQDDARVRKEVVSSLGRFISEDAMAEMKRVVGEEKNPEIVADAIGALGKYPVAQVSETLTASLDRDAYNHRIAESAIQAMQKQGDPGYIPAIRKHLEEQEQKFSAWDFGVALNSLAYLSREEEGEVKDSTREFIAGFLQTPKATLRTKVIAALGTLEDPKAAPLIQGFVGSGTDEDNGESKAAEEALTKINGGKKQSQEVQDLRKQLTELQKKLKEIEGKLEKK